MALPIQAAEVGGWDVQPNGASSCSMRAAFGDGSKLDTTLHKDGKVEFWVFSKAWRFGPDNSYQESMITFDTASRPDAFPVIIFAPSRAWQGEYAYLASEVEPAFLAAFAASTRISIQVETAGRTVNADFRTENPVAAIAELRRCTAARPG